MSTAEELDIINEFADYLELAELDAELETGFPDLFQVYADEVA